MTRKLVFSAVHVFALWAMVAAEAAELPAFPGAEGYGATTPGGRGGKVCIVTTTQDYAPGDPVVPGSLRAAIDTEGPRVVVFAVSGIIELKATMVVQEPYLTLAAQTAPGMGVCLKNYAFVLGNTHDVVIRYLRSRPGDVSGPTVGRHFGFRGAKRGAGPLFDELGNGRDAVGEVGPTRTTSPCNGASLRRV